MSKPDKTPLPVRSKYVVLGLSVLVAGVFVALSLRHSQAIEEQALRRAAASYSTAIASFRTFYTEVVAAPLLESGVDVTHDYHGRPGAVPIPATMTIDLADYITARDQEIAVAVVSDFPFPWRQDRSLDGFERDALAALRQAGGTGFDRFEASDVAEERLYRYAAPVVMGGTCVGCHNSHPDSPKTDWQVGDVRGIQVIDIPVRSSLWTGAAQTDLWLLFGFVAVTLAGSFVAVQSLWGRNRRAFSLLGERTDRLDEAVNTLREHQRAVDRHAIISMTDLDGNITYANDKFLKISGYDISELLGRNHRIINSGHHDPEFFETMWATITSGRTWSGQILNRAKSGQYYWVESTIVPLKDEAGQPRAYMSIRTDITERKRVEADLLRSKEEADRANRAKTDFLATMSHEIRTPMNGVIGMTGLLLDTEVSTKQRDYIRTIKTSGEALLRIINDILDLSKIDEGKLELEPGPFDLGDLVDSALELVHPRARDKGLAVELRMDPALRRSYRADAGRLRQILLNLLTNAVKFTDAGSVTLRVEPEGRVVGAVRLAVEDTGMGIAAEDLDRVFQKFSQVDSSVSRRFEGTGLGLAICKLLAEAMGGSIGVISTPGQGSCFWVTLPLEPIDVPDAVEQQADETVDADPYATASGSGSGGQRLRILVAEDNPVNQLVARGHLEKLGHYVDIVADGQEAIDAVQRLPYDLVFMDVQMPLCDGFQATREIRALEAKVAASIAEQGSGEVPASVPIVAMTANAMAGDRERCLAAGMTDYLPKPIQHTALAALLKDMFEG